MESGFDASKSFRTLADRFWYKRAKDAEVRQTMVPKDWKPVGFLTLSLPFGRNFLVCLSGTVLPEWSQMRPTLSASRTGALSLTAFVLTLSRACF